MGKRRVAFGVVLEVLGAPLPQMSAQVLHVAGCLRSATAGMSCARFSASGLPCQGIGRPAWRSAISPSATLLCDIPGAELRRVQAGPIGVAAYRCRT